MATLTPVADGAYPQADYSFLPPGCRIWAGYVGGHTAHPWTNTEINAARAAGLTWWAIWTAVQGRAITRGDASADAAGMLAGLARIGYPRTDPVIYDVEYSTWSADPQTTEDAAQFWCATMRASGYVNALWYGPRDSVASWRADWTGTPPTSLPPGVVGVQYDHALAGDRYDISLFDLSLLEVPDMPLTSADVDMIEGRLANWSGKLHDMIVGIDRGEGYAGATAAAKAALAAVQALAANTANLGPAITAVQTHVTQVQATLAALPPDATPEQIAAELAKLQPSEDAQAILVALADALTKGTAPTTPQT